MASKRIVKDPIYQQLNRLLRERMSSTEFKTGNKFLTERQICQEYNVSRATANKALSNLVSEGLLEFKKGVGTFIRTKPLTSSELSSLVSFTKNVSAAGLKPATRVLNFKLLKGKEIQEPEVIDKLGVEPEEYVYLIDRLRLANDIPLILEHRYIVAKYCPNLTEYMLTRSLYLLFEDKYKLRITGSEECIQAVTIKGPQAKLLGINSGKAGFLLTAVGYINDNTPLWYERTLHRPNGFEYRCRVQSSQTVKKLQQRILISKELNAVDPADETASAASNAEK